MRRSPTIIIKKVKMMKKKKAKERKGTLKIYYLLNTSPENQWTTIKNPKAIVN